MAISIKDIQAPKNKIEVTADIKIILLYSAKKNKANPIAEYSTLYPETNSASASGKSKGCRFVSAKAHIKKRIKIIKRGFHNQTLRCVSTTSEKFKVPVNNNTEINTVPKDTS
jgi:hypothetical protein